MPNTVHVVLDTNVLVSATLVSGGFPARILLATLNRQLTLVLSPYLLGEYLDVIQRPHIVKKYPALAERVAAYKHFFRKRTRRVEPHTIERVVPDDPKDDAILACAKAGRAKYIVSGDEHLLQLREYRGIQILTPREFVEQVLQAR